MPQNTVIREEFAQAMRLALCGLTPNQASYKVQVSDEWIRKMLKGRVPSEAIIHRIAVGLDVNETELLIAAGYEQPSDLVERCLISLRNSDISEEGIKAIEDFIRRRLEEERNSN